MATISEEQKDHIEYLQEQFHKKVADKYIAGVKEHKGFILNTYTDLAIIDMAIEETIDQFVYLMTLRERMVGR